MPDELYEELLAKAVEPERPSAVVEEDVLLRLEAEIERCRQAAALGDGLSDGRLPNATVEVVDYIGRKPERNGPVVLSRILGLVAAVLVGFLLLTSGEKEAVHIDGVAESDPPAPTTVAVENEVEVAAILELRSIELVNSVCREVLPGLTPGARNTIQWAYGNEDEAITVRERFADLKSITEGLSVPMSQLGAEYQPVADNWKAHLAAMKNTALLFDQELFDGLRHSIPVLTSDLKRLVLSSLVDVGADQCGLWAEW